MSSPQELPSIYEYLDVRTFLSDYREARKVFDPGFTHTYICYALGQKKSKGYFTNVVRGRVKIGPTLVERFIELLDFGKEEAAYFRHLVRYSQCGEPDEKSRLLQELILHNRKSCVSLSHKELPYYENWQYSVIRALLDIVDFNGENLQDISERLLFKMKKSDLKKAISVLQETNLIAPNAEGYLKPTNATVSPGSAIQKELLLQNQIKQLGYSQEIVLNPAARPQKVTTMTVSINEETYREMKKRIDALKEEIRSLARNEQGPAERLYQVNIHLFPHSN